jgi:endonuclease-3
MLDKINQTTDIKQHANQIIEWLRAAYPEALNHTNALELLIATILSAQCTDERVNVVTENLFRKYRNCKDYANALPDELEQDIHSTGFFRNKAKSIRLSSEKILSDFGGEVPRTMEEMLTLPGVARKTANVVLGNVFGIPSGVVVDTHVSRVSQRLGLTIETAPEKIERDLMQLVPQYDWIMFSHWLIEHGRKICQARKPKCAECGLEPVCPASRLKPNHLEI